MSFDDGPYCCRPTSPCPDHRKEGEIVAAAKELTDKAAMVRIMSESSDRTKWETDFLASLADQLEQGRPLTERQEDKLHQIQLRN